MSMKKCSVCKQDKTIDMFFKDSSRKDGYSNRCKSCESNRQKNRKTVKRIKIKGENKIKRFKLLKKNLRCSLCNEKSGCCLDFHHIYNNKHEYLKGYGRSLSKFISTKKPEDIIKELNKCICICSNCHRKIHSGEIILTEEQKENNKLDLPENLFNDSINIPIDDLTNFYTFGGCGDNSEPIIDL